MSSNSLRLLIYTVPATLIAIVFHEFSHALVSYICGDKNVKADGRLSLNPIKHLDPIGTFCLLFFHFGWAKPVMVNTRNYKNKKLDFCLVALAGPLMNFLLAFVSLIFFFLTARFFSENVVSNYFYYFFQYLAIINIGLGVFNLIPIPPLDGSNVLMTFLPDSWNAAINRYRKYLPIFLMIVIFTGSMSNILSYLNSGIFNGMWRLVLNIFGYSFTGGATV